MIIEKIEDMKDELGNFNRYNCVVIICRYNGGKSSIITDLIHEYFSDENVYYITFIEQSKPNFIPRKSRLNFGEIVKDRIIVLDEIADEEDRDVRDYAKKLIEKNLVIILSNPYANSNNAVKEINLFKEQEKEILPEGTFFIFVKN